MIAFNCPKCKAALKTADDKAGLSSKCPNCGSAVQIPHLPDVLNTPPHEDRNPIEPTATPPVERSDPKPAIVDQDLSVEQKKDSAGEKPSGRLAKILATVGGSILIPVFVAVVSKWLDPAVLMSKNQPVTIATSTQPEGHSEGTKAASGAIAPAKSLPASPRSTPLAPGVGEQSLNLITANLADKFYSFGWSTAAKNFARNNNVDPNLFHYIEQLPDGSRHPSIHVVPDERLALLSTKEAFENYSLNILWRWGDKSTAKQASRARHAAIMLHILGPEGGVVGPLPQSVSVHIHDGQVGNIRLFGPENAIKCRAWTKKVPGWIAPIYDPSANEKPLASTGSEGGPNRWNGTIYCRDFDPNAENKAREAGNKPGGWNRLRIESNKGKLTVYVNNRVVNEISDCTPSRGRIGFTSNMFEWYIGKLELVPKAP